MNGYDKLKICFSGGKTNISEMGFGNLTITNHNDFTIKNLAIELNPLIKDEETGEYNWINLWETIFADFESNLFAYNINLKGRVEVINNGEDVYLVFLEIPPYDKNDPDNTTISIDIPFVFKDECTYYMSLFINGLELKYKPLSNANTLLPYLTHCTLNNNYVEEHYAKFIITDTMLVELKINNYNEYINIDDYQYLYDSDCNLICNNK